MEFDQDTLSKTYDMPIMVVVLNDNGKAITYQPYGAVEANTAIGTIA